MDEVTSPRSGLLLESRLLNAHREQQLLRRALVAMCIVAFALSVCTVLSVAWLSDARHERDAAMTECSRQ